MRVFVLTSDNYLPMVRLFNHQANKYWAEQEFIVAGFKAPDFPLPGNFGFLSLGNQADYPVTRWSDALIKLLHMIPDEVVCLMLEDYLLKAPVYQEAVRMLEDYCKQFRYVVRMDLTGDVINSENARFYGQCGHLTLMQHDPFVQYHLSLMTAIWRKEHLLRVLKPGETPWDVEMWGTPRLGALHQEMIVLGSKEWPVKHTLAFRGGDSGKLLLEDLPPADVEEMRSLGYLKPWEG